MTDDVFTAEGIKLSRWFRLCSWWRSVGLRKVLCKEFCTRLAINYPPKDVKKHQLPTTYPINLPIFQDFFEKRDRIILGYKTTFEEMQRHILDQIEKDQEELRLRSAHIAEHKLALANLKRTLNRVKDPSQYVARQHEIEIGRVKISNLAREYDLMDERIKEAEQKFIRNEEQFIEQCKIVDRVFDQHINTFILSATREFQGLTTFVYTDMPHCDPVEATITEINNQITKESKNGTKKKK